MWLTFHFAHISAHVFFWIETETKLKQNQTKKSPAPRVRPPRPPRPGSPQEGAASCQRLRTERTSVPAEILQSHNERNHFISFSFTLSEWRWRKGHGLSAANRKRLLETDQSQTSVHFFCEVVFCELCAVMTLRGPPLGWFNNEAHYCSQACLSVRPPACLPATKNTAAHFHNIDGDGELNPDSRVSAIGWYDVNKMSLLNPSTFLN